MLVVISIIGLFCEFIKSFTSSPSPVLKYPFSMVSNAKPFVFLQTYLFNNCLSSCCLYFNSLADTFTAYQIKQYEVLLFFNYFSINNGVFTTKKQL